MSTHNICFHEEIKKNIIFFFFFFWLEKNPSYVELYRRAHFEYKEMKLLCSFLLDFV